jgi:hypothetical protein
MTHLVHIQKLSSMAASALLALFLAVWLSGCSTPAPPPPPAPTKAPPMTPPAPAKPPAPVALPAEPVKPQLPTSNARNAHEYRVDAAKHLYKLNGARIFKGRMPPMLYAVGVLDIEVDKQGQVSRTYWVRAPSHAPEVMHCAPSRALSRPCPHGQGGVLRCMALAQERKVSTRHPHRGSRLKR